VDEEEFFYSRETGGTIVSSALKLMHRIIEERYPTEDWNIYAAQASDGDNWNDDDPPSAAGCSRRRYCRWCSTIPMWRSRRTNTRRCGTRVRERSGRIP